MSLRTHGAIRLTLEVFSEWHPLPLRELFRLHQLRFLACSAEKDRNNITFLCPRYFANEIENREVGYADLFLNFTPYCVLYGFSRLAPASRGDPNRNLLPFVRGVVAQSLEDLSVFDDKCRRTSRRVGNAG